MDKPGLVDYLIAPLNWLERSRGWKRLALLLLYATTALVVGVLGWRGLSLWRLPDIGDPFDVDKYGTVAVADADNAMVLYREAEKTLIPSEGGGYKPAGSKAWQVVDWSTADPEVRRWAEDNRPAFATWLEGTDRPDSLLVQPRDQSSQGVLVPIYSLRDFARLALLEASRLAAAGDLAGSWRLHRAHLRASRHAGMHGGMMQRHVGHSILSLARGELRRWSEAPKITAELLHRAVADLEACRAMTPPASEVVRCEYFIARTALDDPNRWRYFGVDGPEGTGQWYNHITFVPDARHFLMREPERSRRILRLTTAGQLAQCDRPAAVRPKLVSRNYSIYAIDARTPPAVASLAPEELADWADRSWFSAIGADAIWMTRLDAEASEFDTLRIAMAERAYQMEHGRPPKTYGDLLGPYLKTLPDGIEAVDRVSASSDPG